MSADTKHRKLLASVYAQQSATKANASVPISCSTSEGEWESHPNYTRLAMFARRGEPPILHGIHCFLCK